MLWIFFKRQWAICLINFYKFVTSKNTKITGSFEKISFHRKSVISRIKNDVKAMKRPIYIFLSLVLLQSSANGIFLRYGRFYGPQKNTMIRSSTASVTTVSAIGL